MLPEILKNKAFIGVPELAEIMGISRSQAYIFIKTAPFNILYAGERRVVIPTNSFIEWYESLGKTAVQAE